MPNYFSASFVMYHIFNRKYPYSKDMKNYVDYTPVIFTDEVIDKRVIYVDLSTLMAFDFYREITNRFPEYSKALYGRTGRYLFHDIVKMQTTAIAQLPSTGWNMADYKFVMMKPQKGIMFMYSSGTNFTCACKTSKLVIAEYTYSGAEFLARLDRYINDKFTTHTEQNGQTWYSVLSLTVRERMKLEAAANVQG